jgi:hypothetical protein
MDTDRAGGRNYSGDCLAELRGCPGRKADIETDRPTLTFGEIQPLFWHVRSNGVEPRAILRG